MAVNTIENRTLFMEACDQQLIEGATSGWMEANAGQVKYTGGDTVKIPTLSTTGLGDYDRNAGYPKGGVSVKYQTKTMTQDRGTSFFLDRIEVDESGDRDTVKGLNLKIYSALAELPDINVPRQLLGAAEDIRDGREERHFSLTA